MTDFESRILERYCGAAVCISPNGDGVISSVAISKYFGITKYAARKAIHALVGMGYLQRAYYGGLSDWDWQVHCYHGFAITKKAEETLEFRKALYQECKIDADIWGGGTLWTYWRSCRKRHKEE